jgi:hypothetical protein
MAETNISLTATSPSTKTLYASVKFSHRTNIILKTNELTFNLVFGTSNKIKKPKSGDTDSKITKH